MVSANVQRLPLALLTLTCALSAPLGLAQGEGAGGGDGSTDDGTSPGQGFVVKYDDLYFPGDFQRNKPEEMPLSLISLTTTDPAGHSCCIEPPPENMTLDWDAVVRLFHAIDDESSTPSYLPIEDISITPYGKITGENFSTVAGRSNIRTTLSGQFMRNGIELELTVGANGGLPSGEPIRFSVETEYADDLRLIQIANPVLHLNTATDTAELYQWLIDPAIDEQVDLYLAVEDITELLVDWFVVMLTPEGVMSSFNIQTGQFEPGITPSYQGNLMNIDPTMLVSLETPPEPGTIIAFGVDAPDGQLNDDVRYSGIEFLSVIP